MALFKMDAVPKDDRAIEREPWPRAVPADELADGVVVGPLTASGAQAVEHRDRPIRVCVVSIALSIAFGSVSASLERRSAQDQKASGTMYSSKRMADGKQRTTHNLNVNTVPSCCYEDAELNCRQYGRLYMWESARRGCQSLGDGWRLPTNGGK